MTLLLIHHVYVNIILSVTLPFPHSLTLSLPLSHPPSLSHRESVEFLCNEGHIYSTVDDNHFKSTDH